MVEVTKAEEHLALSMAHAPLDLMAATSSAVQISRLQC
jgi:hypothetical protein